jgi:hypothetical protein
VTAPAVPRHWTEPASGAAASAAIRDHLGQLRRAASLGAVLLSALAVHVGVVPHLMVGGAAPDVLLVGVVAVATARGARAGAAFGFAAGIGADLFVATPLGTSALAYTLLGHAFGRSSPSPSSAGKAGALCRPASPCFACRRGRLHAASAIESQSPGRSGSPGPEGSSWPIHVAAAALPKRRSQRRAGRRAALRRSVALAFLGVGAGRMGAVVVATTLAGVPFPDGGLLRIAAVAAVSAPLGPAVFAAVGRLGSASRGRR